MGQGGSRNEQIDEHGIAHFLEHMAFKGTQERNARDIVEQIEKSVVISMLRPVLKPLPIMPA